ncbi:ArsR/SmtB family transcription factor [Evansella halocellulosilytica]|uniref:ArsR/SmtB family transcription factor n=1 Tax=Evansella halocellulosilytica TaxID=2011013 RepID=UPI0015CE2EC6|nr:metalloregulator ArsR/SmtB family transcription factor [Evansella halocellulosilytica]
MKKIYHSVYVRVSPVIELFAAMFRVNCHEQLKADSNRVPIELENWVVKTRDSLSGDLKSSLEVFFHFESFFGLTFIKSIYESEKDGDIEVFLSWIKQISPESLVREFLTSGYGSSKTIPANIQYAGDAAKVISDMNLPEVEKWKLTYLCTNQEETKERFIHLIEQFYRQFYFSEKEKLANIHEQSAKELERELEDDLPAKISSLVNIDYDINQQDEVITFIPSYFYDSASLHIDNWEGTVLFVYGVRHLEQTLHKQVEEERMVEGFKALADENRIKMIKILNENPCSGYELAQKLGLSNSTISHHISILSSQGFVTITKQNKKKVYTVNKKMVGTVLKSMTNLLAD